MVNFSLPTANADQDDAQCEPTHIVTYRRRYVDGNLVEVIPERSTSEFRLKPPQQPQGPGYIRRRANLRARSRY